MSCESVLFKLFFLALTINCLNKNGHTQIFDSL